MLSYIHAYHAGNFADILKHTVFAYTLEHLLKKEKPFTVIDCHSASGKYAFDDDRLEKTGEAKNGIKKLLNKNEKNLQTMFGNSFSKILVSYAEKGFYPGSPEIARCYLRKNDQLILNELHPKIKIELEKNLSQKILIQKNEMPHIQVLSKDAAKMLNAVLPPKIKRGCVIIDPSYEDSDDFYSTAQYFIASYKKWMTGTFLLWYPLLKDRENEAEFLKQTIYSNVEKQNKTDDEKCIFFELQAKNTEDVEGFSKMYGSGMLVVNPPFDLKERIQFSLNAMEDALKE
ncbi:23S rRNA (adenine(2030)-N(6))-methyltransferase RlmJ [Treponema pectinovorum]|uniref:23S rRNA (adenine(2030)-N(6))-methyltransferase RlmJ n=1 Tax=Treponema pectinovorum TaxID=164 RepID=UPI003D8D3401